VTGPEYDAPVTARLGEILVGDGVCPEKAVRDALKNQIIFGGRLGTNLLEMQAVTEEALARALGKQHGLPCLFGDLQLDSRAMALLGADIADRFDVVPYVLSDRRLAVIVVDPRNLAALDEVAFATGKQVHPIVAPEARVWTLLRQHYAVERNLRGIDVDFGSLRERNERAFGVGAGAPDDAVPLTTAADLMDEGAFDALYAGAALARPGAAPRSAPPPAAPPPAAPPTPPRAPARAAPPPTAARPPAPPPARAAPPPRPLAPDDVIELTDLLLEPEPIPAPAPPAPEPSPLSFAEAVRFLEGVDQRDAIANTVLRYARTKFKRSVILTVQRGAAHGWAGLGEKLGPEAVRRMHLALGTPGILDTVARTQAHFLGPIPKTDSNIRLLKALGGGVPANAFVVPILAMGRVVNLFYADNGRGAVVDAGDLGELLILATRIAKSYDTLLQRVR
jgi:hypothetical protein